MSFTVKDKDECLNAISFTGLCRRRFW